MTDYRTVKADVVRPAELDLSDVAINSAVDSNWFSVEGCRQIDIFVSWTKGAGTGVEFYLVYTPDDLTGTPREYHYPVAENSGSGTVTYYRRKFTIALSASDNVGFPIPINAKHAKIVDLLATGSPTSSDKATVTVYKSTH